MQRQRLILKTKLLPPRAVPNLLVRPRLTEKLCSNLHNPLTLIAADAGCGKTTLIAGFIREQNRPSVWYQLDHTDADPAVFLGYLTEGIRKIIPGFGNAIFQYLAEANEEILRYPERAVDLLIHEVLQSAEQPLILVLDDYHHIGRKTQVHTFVDRLLQYASDLIHIVITTRDMPPLAMMRRRTQSALLVVTRDDLLFNDAEVRELFRRTLDLELTDEQAAEYGDRTQGWITALQLVRQVADREMNAAGGPVDLIEILRQSEKDIFDYFAEEVFSRESDSIQKLLLSLSLLDTLPLETCCLVFPDERCSALLPELAQKNVFLTVVGDAKPAEEYRLHPLFRDFLLRRYRAEAGRAGLARVRDRIARVFIANGQWEQALPYLIEAGQFDEASRVIAGHGREFLTAGAFVTLNNFSSQIPDAALDSHPYALLHISEVARIQGETEKASSMLRRAAARFADTEDSPGQAEALHSLASLARRQGKFAEAMDLLDEAEMLCPNPSETRMKCANTRGLCFIAEGRWTEAEQQLRFALDLAEESSNVQFARLVMHNLALPPGFRGDFGEALRWFRKIFVDADDSRRLPQEAIGHLNVARLHIYRGEFDAAARHLELSLETCRLFSMRSLLPEIYEAYANYHRELGDITRATDFYERARKAYEQAGIDPATKELDEERAKLLLRTGDHVRARALLEHLADARRDAGNGPGVRTALLGLAQADLAEGRVDNDLVGRLSDLLSYFHDCTRYYDEAVSAMALAEALHTLERECEAVQNIQRVLDLSARFDYDFWLRREMRRNPQMFSLEEIVERLPADLRSELTAPETAAELIHPDRYAGPALFDLTVRLLGPVEIHRDPSRPFAADAWTTRRARDIFCMIAAGKHRRAAKEVLIDTFWPGDDPAVVEKNFHPTISHIRKALNSNQSIKQNFLLFRDGAYQLDPELSYFIDSEEFSRLIAEAESAKRAGDNERLRESLEAAHEIYRGEFMEGIYDDWVQEQRSYFSEQFARITGALARLSAAERRAADAHRYAAEALRADPYREDMHRLILRLLAAQGQTAAVKKHFDSMRELLKAELGVEPSSQTLRVAAELGLLPAH